MKAKPAEVERAMRDPASFRYLLLYGPDESGSRALVKALAAAMGEGAERIDLSGPELKADPARLADEAASLSMFGDRRWILVEQAGEEVLASVTALSEAPVAGNPVAIVAGALRPSSKLLKLALADRNALACASYPVEGRDGERVVADLARPLGLEVRSDVARRVADSAGGNRAIVGHELAKFALYLDASPSAVKMLDHDTVDAVGADSDSGDLSRLVDSVLDGDSAALDEEIERLRTEGQEGIGLIRAMLRRLILLARLRAEVEQGKSPAAVMASSGKSLFWKDEKSVAGQIGRWTSPLLAKAVSRLIEAERQVMTSGGPGIAAADAELFTIARQAARLR